MATGTGIDAAIGFGEESTYGTPVVVDRFYEFVDESLKLDIQRLESQAIRAGSRVLRSDRWGAGKKSVGGSVTVEVSNKGMGRLLKHAFGTVSTGAAVSGAYPHTFTPGDLIGDSLTGQVQRPDVNGTIRPFTYHGLKVASWELTAKVDEIGRLKVDFAGEDEDTATGAATVAYPATVSLLTFVQATLSVAGSAVSVNEATLRGDNGLNTERFFLGSQLTKEAREAKMREYGGTLVGEFEDLTAYNRFVNGTEAALVLLFEGATIGGAEKYTLQATCNVRFDGDTPNVGGPDIVAQSLPFKCLDSGAGAASAITVLYKTTDATP